MPWRPSGCFRRPGGRSRLCRSDEQAPQRRHIAAGQGRAGIRDAGLDLGHAWLARQDADEHQAVAGEEGQLAGVGVIGQLRHATGLFVQALARQLNGGCQRFGELDALQIADVVAVEVDQVGAGLEGLQRVQRQRGKPGACRCKAMRHRGRCRGVDPLARFQVAQLEQQCIGVCAVFQREMSAHREDLLRHQTQFLDDGAFGAPFDGAQGVGH